MSRDATRDEIDGATERRRILAENARRRREVPAERYAPWSRAELFMRHGRRRAAAELLAEAGGFPGHPANGDARCLEIGFGDGGWISDLIAWGVPARRIHGVELDPCRAHRVHRRIPGLRLAVGDAGSLPYGGGAFDLVIASTVFSSILDDDLRRRAAAEIGRVLRPGGVFLFYDFAVDNPKNPNVRGVGVRRLRALFPGFDVAFRRVTLAPPISRRVVGWSWWLAELLEAVPFLRTHLVAVLRPPVSTR